ncbi:MAG: SH3 domain-containing protein [Leptospiraceae bacterium]|nr:peptidoglycan DD-metalloendopeptidase family protein [Leptospiraceae bacterium]MCK6380343.1 SH3 domain-containing protein [Leptospiraceae bacterium]NUM41649.1 peptidoglycan DD-metalloendopeptidase family protein [Leptospiraceae bacterium]
MKKTHILNILKYLISIALLFSINLLIADSTEQLNKKAQEKLQKLKEKDEKHREAILQKFYSFVSKAKARFPELDIQEIPIDPSLATGVIEHNDRPGDEKIKEKQIFAFVLDPYNLRAEPNPKNKEYIGKVKKGEKIEVVMILTPDEKNNQSFSKWCLIRMNNKKEGYIPSDLISNNPPVEDRKKQRKKVGNENHLPNFLSSLVGFTDFESNLNRDGLFFNHSEEYIFQVAQSMPKNASDYPPMIVTADILKIRENQGIESEEIGSISRGTVVNVKDVGNEESIDGINGRWLKIKSDDYSGWVFGGYLKPQEEEENPDELKSGESRYVKSVSLRVRDEPSEQATVITTLEGQTKVKIKDAKSEVETLGGIRSKWIYIEAEDFEGWVFGGFVSKKKGMLIDSDDIAKYFQAPIDGFRSVSSKFGPRVDPVTGKKNAFHAGLDIPAVIGTPIRVVSDGKVYRVDPNHVAYGMLTILEHKNNIYTYYAHQSVQKVKEGDKLKTGETLGEVGSTGKSTGPHLHFEVRRGSNMEVLNPNLYLPK